MTTQQFPPLHASGKSKSLSRRGFLQHVGALVGVGTLLAACTPVSVAPAAPASQQDTSAAETSTVRFFMVAGQPEEPAWQGIVDGFNEQNDEIQVDFELMFGGWEEFHRKLRGYLAAGDAPDMARNQWLMLPTWVKSGELVDLMPYAQRDNFPFEDHWEAPVKGLTLDGKLYGLPPGIYTVARYYNRDLFEAAGLEAPSDWNNPWTFEQAREAALALTKGEGPEKQFGINLFMDLAVSLTWLWCNGGDFINETSTECILDESAAIEALQFQRDLILEDHVAPTPTDTQTIPFFEMFNTGRIGIIEGGPWMLPAIEASGINWGVMPVFQGQGPVETVEFVEYYSIFKAGKNPDQAWEVVKYFQTEDAERILAANRIAGMPTLKALAAENAEAIFGRDANIWVQAMDFARTPYTIVNYEEAMSEYGKRFDLVKLGEMPVDQAATEVAEVVNQLIAENQA